MESNHHETIRRKDLRTLSQRDLEKLLVDMGQPRFRAKQVMEWALGRHVTSFDEMTNIPQGLRESLAQSFSLGGVSEVARQESRDGSRKYVVSFDDGVSVECVGMPSRGKLSVCISTQAGCGMACAFCATGAHGLRRSLTSSEMVDQVTHVSDDFNTRATSVVFMGQGEPFANYDATLGALRMLNSPTGLGIGARHLTVSTCGIIPGIRKFSKEPEQFTLAISLHSAVQSTRNLLMPGVKRYSLLHLHETMADYVAATGRRPSYEYALISGFNDTDNELSALVDFTAGTLAHVNIIRLNDVEGSKFRPSSQARAEEFVHRLERAGVETTIRNSRGTDIDAACGQLHQRVSS
jgi:23S rRNA (adenine2503-C2)-methyltransferase